MSSSGGLGSGIGGVGWGCACSQRTMLNSAILFFMYVPIMTFLALVLAVVLNSKRVRGFQFFRTLIFMPYITNIVAAGFTFRLLLNEKYGLFNIILGLFH